MKARFYSTIHSCNPLIVIEFEDTYYINSDEFDQIASIIGAYSIEYI